MQPTTPDLNVTAIRAIVAEQFPDLALASIVLIVEGGYGLGGADAPVARLAEGVDAVRYQSDGDDAQQQWAEGIGGQRQQRPAEALRLARIML